MGVPTYRPGLMQLQRTLFSATLVLIAAASANASDPLFADVGALDATLELPLSQVLRNRREPEPQEGIFRIDGKDFDVSVVQRGKSRLEHCSFPPLWLDFDKKAVSDSILEGQNKLKLVSHCKPALERRGYLAAEMLVYRMLNKLTEASFRVRALRINYMDSVKKSEQTHGAFLIEHKKRLAKRLDGELLDVEAIGSAELEPEETALSALFQYMIGNTDFSFLKGPADDNCCHNAVPVRLSSGDVIPVAYDFDSTGLVNPPYATPSEGLGLRRMTQRRFRGLCPHNEHTQQAAAKIIAAKDELLALVAGFDELPNMNHGRVSKYVAQFFKELESEKTFNSRILKRCRKI